MTKNLTDEEKRLRKSNVDLTWNHRRNDEELRKGHICKTPAHL